LKVNGKEEETKMDAKILEVRPKSSGTGQLSPDLLHRVLDVVANLLFIENLDDLLEEIAQTVTELFPIEQVVIWLAEEDGLRKARVALGYSEEKKSAIQGIYYTMDEVNKKKNEAIWISKYSWFFPAELTIKDGLDERDYLTADDNVDLLVPRKNKDDWHELDYLDVSIISKDGKYIGALEIEKTKDGKIPSLETIQALEIFTSVCSVAIELAKQRDKELAIADAAEKRATQISRILGFSRNVLFLEDTQNVVSSILKNIQELFNFKSASIMLLDEKERFFRYFALTGYTSLEIEYAKSLRVPIDAVQFDISPEFMIGRNAYYLPAEKLTSKELIWEIYTPGTFGDLQKKLEMSRSHPDAWHPLDNLVFVIHNRQGKVIGLIYADNPKNGLIPSAETIDGIGIFTSLVSIALENAKNYADTLSAKEEIDLLNSLLFHDVTMLNSSMRDSLEIAINASLPKDQRVKYIRGTLNNLDRMIDLIQKVRRLSSIQYLDSSSMVRLDLASVLKSQIQRSLENFKEKDIKGLFDEFPEQCYVMANDLIWELFNDIITYSARNNYSDRPELRISIMELKDELTEKKFWDVKISDNGPGIPDELKSSVFNILPRNTEIDLSDVGLFAVKSIVSLYGGRTWVDDRVVGDHTKGSIFHILLPAA